MSLAWPSFCSTPSTISQQSFAPGVSHIFGALSVLKMRHAFMLLPSKSDFHGPGFAAAGCIMTALSSNAIVRGMRVDISRRQTADPEEKAKSHVAGHGSASTRAVVRRMINSRAPHAELTVTRRPDPLAAYRDDGVPAHPHPRCTTPCWRRNDGRS